MASKLDELIDDYKHLRSCLEPSMTCDEEERCDSLIAAARAEQAELLSILRDIDEKVIVKHGDICPKGFLKLRDRASELLTRFPDPDLAALEGAPSVPPR